MHVRDKRNVDFRPLEASDFDQSIDLWKRTPGIGLRSTDNIAAFERFIERNPVMSFAAVFNSQIIGTIMSGHDGRRGYIYHLAVDEDFRRKKIATKLLKLALDALCDEKIDKVTLFVLEDNKTGQLFWEKSGWYQRDDLLIYQKDLV